MFKKLINGLTSTKKTDYTVTLSDFSLEVTNPSVKLTKFKLNCKRGKVMKVIKHYMDENGELLENIDYSKSVGNKEELKIS